MVLNSKNEFFNNDTLFSSLRKGTYNIEKNNLILLGRIDTNQTRQICNIRYSSDNKIVLEKEGTRFAYHDYESSRQNDGISWGSILRGILGLMSLFLVGFLFSRNRSKIDWKLVAKGTGLQVGLAILILKVPFVTTIFEWLSKGFTKLINFSHDGANFLFRSMGTENIDPLLMNFATWILPVSYTHLRAHET